MRISLSGRNDCHLLVHKACFILRIADAGLTNVLCEHNVAVALLTRLFMPRSVGEDSGAS
jgi:hypothetical protein